MKIEQRPWKPQDLLDDLQSIIDEEPDNYLNTRRLTLCMARDYLKEYFSSLSNDPLTLEQLREMDGEPIWVVFTPDADEEQLAMWALVSVDSVDDEIFLLNSIGGSSAYEEVWTYIEAIYRRKTEAGMK